MWTCKCKKRGYHKVKTMSFRHVLKYNESARYFEEILMEREETLA